MSFRAKVNAYGTGQGVAVYDGTWRLLIGFNTNGLSIFNDTSSAPIVLPWNSDTGWHKYDLVVSHGVATLYFDGQRVTKLRLQPYANSDYAEIYNKGQSPSDVQYDYFEVTHETYIDNFEDEALGAAPSHWMESAYDDAWDGGPSHWLVATDGGNKVLDAAETSG